MKSRTLFVCAAAACGLLTIPAARAQDPAGAWFPFNPPKDTFSPTSAIDLRGMNEKQAGDGGVIVAKGPNFIHSKTGVPVRFWAVNDSTAPDDAAKVAYDARLLAKYGVNLVRFHGAVADPKTGAPDPKAVRARQKFVAAMKAEGIYTHLSIYFPVWFSPTAAVPFLKGYAGDKHPFAALYFDPDFQKQYQEWWKVLLTTPDDSGHKLIDDPAVFGVELVNEDSYFFWTFAVANVPDPELKLLEKQFGDWCAKKYGSADAALQKWEGIKEARDNAAEGRLSFRGWYKVFTEKKLRDQDTAQFLAESQANFYASTYKYLRGLGYKGLITASNWTTADPKTLGPLDKFSYTACDFIDRHGYFGGQAKSADAEWAVKPGLNYTDRTALTFESEKDPAKKDFNHPSMDPSYNNLPSMISEVTWNRPDRYRPEAPLFLAAYGALQGSDAIVHFVFDGDTWTVKPGFWMQPWTLMAPSQMAQFPATALLYRAGLVGEGDMMADISLNIKDLYALKGTPMPQGASFDEFRAKDVPKGMTVEPGNVIDPLVHFVGRTNVTFTNGPASSKLKDTQGFIDRAAQTVTSSNGQIKLDYGKGVLTVNAPLVQAVGGELDKAGEVNLKDIEVASPLETLHVIAVALDGQPLATSGKMLLQVMSEEKATDFAAKPVGGALKMVTNIGKDPWLVREISGTVKFKRPDAAQLKVTPLDLLGNSGGAPIGNAAKIQLQPQTVYYLITR